MMMYKKACILLALLGFWSFHANAEIKWTGVKKIISVQAVEHGGFIIGFDSEINSVCTQADTSRLFVYPNQQGVTNESVKSLLSVSLTALTTGMSVDVMYDDATSFCWGKYIVVKK